MIWEGILLYSLLFLGLLYVIGHATIDVLCRSATIRSLLSQFDPIERLPVDFVMGGVVIYTWALFATPFAAFDYASSVILTLFFVGLYIAGLYFSRPNWSGISSYSWVALLAFFMGLVIRVIPIQNYVLGSATDSALHTFFVYSIIRDGGIPLSVFPGSILQFPQGLHVVLAYFSLISGLPPELTTFYELAYFNATILLAAYTFGKILASRQFALILEIIMVGISVYPIAITWGGQIIPWGFTVFFISLGLILQNFLTQKVYPRGSGILAYILPGIIIGYLGSVYAPLYALLFIFLIIVAILERKFIAQKLGSIVILMLASIPLFGIWIYRDLAITNYNSPYLVAQSSIAAYNAAFVAGLQFFPYRYMTTLQGVSRAIYNWLIWPVTIRYPGSTYLFSTLVIVGAGVTALAFLSQKHLSLPKGLLYYSLATLLTIMLWGTDNPVGVFYLAAGPLSILTTELNKADAIGGTILTPFVAAVPIYTIILLAARGKIFRSNQRKYVAPVAICILLVANLVVLPFGMQWLVGNYGVYSVTSSSDYQLLQWMKTGIPGNSIVLVNPYDAGQYVQSIANKTSISLFTGLSYPSQEYKTISLLLANGIINQTTMTLLSVLKVNYVFVGSRAIEFGWNPRIFIIHCLAFRVVQNYYNSYLFQVISTQYSFASVSCNYV
jgi:hypothetical protein